LKLRFGLDRGEPRTLQEVADHFQLKPARIAQIERRALDRLRSANR
jgi:DNA-directed RNA polymerase sigma subunit (sigma70/sigma32)